MNEVKETTTKTKVSTAYTQQQKIWKKNKKTSKNMYYIIVIKLQNIKN